MSPASGFSDSESDAGSGQFVTHAPYCPAHGPINGPLRHLPLPYPLLPVLQEGSYGSETFDEVGSSISSQNSEDVLNVGLYEKDFDDSASRAAIQNWRLNHLRRIQRSDAVYMSDDVKSSCASSPVRICPRCLEKEGAPNRKPSSLTSGGGIQFDSGIDSMDTMKNVSFDTATSSEADFGRHLHPPMANFNNASIQTDLSVNGSGTSSTTDNSFCTTVTTFGVKDIPKVSKATDV